VILAFFKPGALTERAPSPLIKQLFGFQRVHLAPGQSKTVTITATAEALSLVDGAGDRRVEPGSYAVQLTNGVDQTVTGVLDVVGAGRLLSKFAAA